MMTWINKPDPVEVTGLYGIGVTEAAGTDTRIFEVSADIDTTRGMVFNS